MGSIPIEPPLKSANREQNAQAQAEIERLRGETAQRRAENERLRVEYEQAQAEIDRLRSDNSQFLSENERLRYEVSEAQAGSEENAQARGQGDQLRHDNNQLRAQTDALAQELDAWRQEDSQRLQSISSTEAKLETLNRSLRDVIVKLNPAKNGDYQAPPSGASAGSERSLHGSATLDSHFAYLERGLRTVQENQEFKTSQSLEEAESAAATASIALARAEIRVDNLNSQLCDLMLSVDSNYPTPPDATNSELDDQFDYADRSLQALETQLSRVDQLTTNSETRKREGDQSEAVLMGLWDIIQSGFADIQQRKDQRRKMRAEQGLEPDEDDVSGDEGMDVNEPYSLPAFSTKVQWLYAQATKLKDQKSVLKRQIKQQRELNNKSDSAKDEELRSKQDEIDQIRALLESSAQEANKAQTLLSQALQDVEDANNARSANDASTAQFRQQLEERDARIAALEAESRSVQTRMADVSSTVQDAESKLNQAMEDVALLTTKLADAERLAEEKQQEAEAKSKEAKDQQEEMDKMNEMMVSLKTELTFAQAELDGAYGSRKERAAAVAAVKSTVEVEQLKTEVERLKDELASTLKELEGITAETIGAEREKLDVEGRLDDALAARASLEFEMASLRDQLEGEMRNARDKVSRLQEELDAERLKAVPGAGAGARPGAGASMLSEQFRATMKQERKKFQEDIREEQAKRRRLEEELQKLRKARLEHQRISINPKPITLKLTILNNHNPPGLPTQPVAPAQLPGYGPAPAGVAQTSTYSSPYASRPLPANPAVKTEDGSAQVHGPPAAQPPALALSGVPIQPQPATNPQAVSTAQRVTQTPPVQSQQRHVIEPRLFRSVLGLKNGLVENMKKAKSPKGEAIVMSALNRCLGLKAAATENPALEDICMRGIQKVLDGYSGQSKSPTPGEPATAKANGPGSVFDPKVFAALVGFKNVSTNALKATVGESVAEAVALSAIDRVLGLAEASIVPPKAPPRDGSPPEAGKQSSYEVIETRLMANVRQMLLGLNQKLHGA
ncbi:hypothetical protein HYQ44_007423 [Verticillium longisporum]|nr:hypothetical protein HYQ44_007423 [Verticillium longisporum]